MLWSRNGHCVFIAAYGIVACTGQYRNGSLHGRLDWIIDIYACSRIGAIYLAGLVFINDFFNVRYVSAQGYTSHLKWLG